MASLSQDYLSPFVPRRPASSLEFPERFDVHLPPRPNQPRHTRVDDVHKYPVYQSNSYVYHFYGILVRTAFFLYYPTAATRTALLSYHYDRGYSLIFKSDMKIRRSLYSRLKRCVVDGGWPGKRSAAVSYLGIQL